VSLLKPNRTQRYSNSW